MRTGNKFKVLATPRLKIIVSAVAAAIIGATIFKIESSMALPEGVDGIQGIISVSDSTPNPGDTITADIILNSIRSDVSYCTTAADINLQFSPEHFQVSNVALNGPLSVNLGGPSIDNQNGTIRFIVGATIDAINNISLEQYGVDRLATITLQVLDQTGTGTISFDPNTMITGSSVIDFTTIDSTEGSPCFTGNIEPSTENLADNTILNNQVSQTITINLSPTPSDAPTSTPSPSASPTPNASPTPSPSPTPTLIPSPSPTFTPSPTPSDAPPTASPTPTSQPSPTPTIEADVASLSLEVVDPANPPYLTQQPVTINLNLATNAPITGTDILLNLNPSLFTINSFTNAGVFDVTPIIDFNNGDGSLRFSTVQNTGNPFTGSATIATIVLTPKIAQTSSVVFDYDTPGSKTDTNVIAAGTGEDILQAPQNLELSILDNSQLQLQLETWNEIPNYSVTGLLQGEASFSANLTTDTTGFSAIIDLPSTWFGQLREFTFKVTGFLRKRFSVIPTSGVNLVNIGQLKAGDLNDDGVINGVDLGIMYPQWFNTGSADFNGDNVVNTSDYWILTQSYLEEDE